jgi:DNA-binding beta-propeller fold protein YncE
VKNPRPAALSVPEPRYLLTLIVAVAALCRPASADPAPGFAFSIGSSQIPGGLSPGSLGADASGKLLVSSLWNVVTLAADGSYVARWGTQGTGPGQFSYAGPIAFDTAGNIYVADSYNDRIERFDHQGNFLSRWGTHGTAPGQFDYPEGLAVSGSGRVYVSDFYNNRVQIFTTSGGFLGQFGSEGTNAGSLSNPGVIALDSSNNLYVTDSPGLPYDNFRVQKFDPNGGFLGQWGAYGSNLANSIEVAGIATDPANNVYVADGSNNRVQKFTSDGQFVAEWGSPGSGPGEFGTPMGVAIGPTGNYVYVADYYNARINVFAYSAQGPIIYQSPTNQTVPAGTTLSISVGVFGAQPMAIQWQFDQSNLPGVAGVSLVISNVQLSASGSYSVSASNSLGTASSSTATITVLPVVTATMPASSVTATGAVLNGSVEVGGSPSAAWFEWGVDPGYGNIAGVTNLSANTNVALSQPLTGLSGGVVYHYRLVGSNALGIVYGQDAQFQLGLKPGIVTLPVSAISSNSVLLSASVNPEARETSMFFRWGASNPYAYYTATNAVGSGVSPTLVQNQIDGLVPGRIYQAQAVASNALGTAAGNTVSFIAPPWTLLAAPPLQVWTSLASSADGGRLAAVANSDRIFLSSDSGLTWTSNVVLGEPWQSVTMSVDGGRLVAVAGGGSTGQSGPAYFSTNSGNTWTRAATADRNWYAVAASADGLKVAGVDAFGQRVLISTNGGLDWTTNSPPVPATWTTIASSAEGGRLIVAAGGVDNSTNGPLYTSADAGLSWTSNNLPSQYWRSVASSADGRTLVAAVGGRHVGPIYISTDGGNSWALSGAPITNWQAVAVSADGRKLAAVAWVERTPVFLSSDLGLTWQTQILPSAIWSTLVTSADGARIFAAGDQNIVTLQLPATPQLETSRAGDQLALSWLVPSIPLAVEQTLGLTPPTWTNLVASPHLVLTHLRYQVELPVVGPGAFYRLRGSDPRFRLIRYPPVGSERC